MDEQNFWLAKQEAERQRAEAEAAAAQQQAVPIVHEPPIESRSDRDRRELAERDETWARVREQREQIDAERRACQEEAAAIPGWVATIRAEIDAVHELIIEAVGQAIGLERERLEDKLRPLRVQNAELLVGIAELKLANARLREALIERGSSVGNNAGISSALN